MTTANDRRAIIISDNLTMTGPSSSPLRRILCAPFTRRAWAELAYSVVSALLDVVSERAVEKHISNIFSKLGLPPSDSDHRRVLAVLAYLGS